MSLMENEESKLNRNAPLKQISFDDVQDQQKKFNLKMIQMRCYLNEKAFNNKKKGNEISIKIYYCKCKNIIICGSCKSECHDNTVCILVEFTKELNKLFICGCNHNENDGDKSHFNCKFHTYSANHELCLFCDLICKTLPSTLESTNENKYKTCDFIEIDKKTILGNSKINNIILSSKNSHEEIDTLLICKCHNFYHNIKYYQIVFYQKIISNFALNPNYNIFQMLYHKREELLNLMFEPLKDKLFDIDDDILIDYENIPVEIENFEKKYNYMKTLLYFFNNDLSNFLPKNTDFFISCNEFKEYIKYLDKTFHNIELLVKIHKIEFLYNLKAQLLEFYRKYYLYPKISSVFPLIGMDKNTNPIHRLIFSNNKSDLFSSINVCEIKFKNFLQKLYDMILSSMNTFDSNLKLIKEYLFLVEIIIFYRLNTEELSEYVKKIDSVIQKLPNKKRSKLENKIEMIGYYIILKNNDYIIDDYIFSLENSTKKFSFETANRISNEIMSLIFSTKKSVDEKEKNESKKISKIEIFDLLLNDNDYYLESLKSLYKTVNLEFLGSFLCQDIIKPRNPNFNVEINKEILDFFDEMDILQSNYFRKKISNEIFFFQSKNLFIHHLNIFVEKKYFLKDTGNDDEKNIPNLDLQIKIFKSGKITKLIFFIRNFIDISYFIKHKEISELDEMFEIFFNIITDHFCFENPFLISLFFNTNFFNYFFPKVIINQQDEFSENDLMEQEIFMKKIKVSFLFLKRYCKFLKILRKYKFNIDTKYILERLLTIVSHNNNVSKLNFSNINDFLKTFILCIQVNINKTNGIIQQNIANFLRYILNNCYSVKNSLESLLNSNKTYDYYEKKNIDQNILFKRTFKLLNKFNSNYFNYVFSNNNIFSNLKISSKKILDNPNISKYYMYCYAKYYFGNFCQIKENFTYFDAKNLDNIKFLDNLVLKDFNQINDYLNAINMNFKNIFKIIDSEFHLNIEIDNKLLKMDSNYQPQAYYKDLKLLLSFFQKVIAFPIFQINFKIIRLNDILFKTDKNDDNSNKYKENYKKKFIPILFGIKIFIYSFIELKERIVKRHYEDDYKNLFQDEKKREIIKICLFDEDQLRNKIMSHKNYGESSIDKDIIEKLKDKRFININSILKSFENYKNVFFINQNVKHEERKENFFHLLKIVIKKYQATKAIFKKNNILHHIFSDKTNNVVMKNICDYLLSLLNEEIEEGDEDLNEVEQDHVKNDVEERDQKINNFSELSFEKINSIDELELNKKISNFTIFENSTPKNNNFIKKGTINNLDLAKNIDKNVQFNPIIKQEQHKEIHNIYHEKHLFAYECIIKLFTIDPEFFQIILVKDKKTGNLIKRITEREIIFLLQFLINDFYNLDLNVNKIQPSSYTYLTYLIEFLRLFCENFNKMFKSLFFQLNFEKHNENDDDNDDESEINIDNDKDAKTSGKYYFINIIFKFFSSVLSHLIYYESQKEIFKFYDIKPIGPEHFSTIFDYLSSFLIEIIQGNKKENFEMLNSSFSNFFNDCNKFINEIKIENDDYHNILTKILKILLEFLQEGEVPNRMKMQAIKKINSSMISKILIYKTKVLNKLCEVGNIDELNMNITNEEVEIIFKNYFLTDIVKVNINEDDLSSYSVVESSNDDKELINKKEPIEKIEPQEIFNNEIALDDHKKLIHLYSILFSTKIKEKDEDIIESTGRKMPTTNINKISKICQGKNLEMLESEKLKKMINKKNSLNEKSDDNHVQVIFEMCTSIYQYFFIIDSYNFNDQGNKFIQFFEKAREETIKYYKFKFYDLIQRLIGKKSKKENKSVTITINEIFMFYSSILKSIEVVHKIKLILDEIETNKFEYLYKYLNLEMKKNDFAVSNEDTIIRKIVFLVDPICLYLNFKEAYDLIEKQNFEDSTLLLTYVMEHIGDFRNIVNLRKKIKSDKNLKRLKIFEILEKIDFFYLQIANLIFGIIINVRIATSISLNEFYQVIEENDLLFSIISVLHLIQIYFSVGTYFYMHYIKLSEIRELRTESKEFLTNKDIFLKYIDLSLQDEIIYIIWSLVFASIAIIFDSTKFLYSLLLFPIFQFFPKIQDILYAIKLRVGEFLTAGLVIIVLVFFYSLFAIYFFKDNFINPDTKENSCETLSFCFFTLLDNGLHGDGIGEDDDNEVTNYYFYAFTWTFYFSIILIMLNAINGIIVDVFQYLREKVEGENNFKEKCCVCSNHKSIFESNDISYKMHIEKEHFILDYIYYILTQTSENCKEKELNYSEYQVKKSIDQYKIDFFPIEKSMTLDKLNEG